MSGDIFRQDSMDEKVCITQYEQKEYDSCSWENEEFGKIFLNFRFQFARYSMKLPLKECGKSFGMLWTISFPE